MARKKKEPKPEAPKKGKGVASDADVLKEARILAVTIRGLDLQEDGLNEELKGVRARIKSLTKQQNELLLDDGKGQARLDFSVEIASPPPSGRVTDEHPAGDAGPAAVGEQTTIGTTILRVVPKSDGDCDAILIETKDGSTLEPRFIGTYVSVGAAKKDLLDEIAYHGDAPEWKPVEVTQGELARDAGKKSRKAG